MVAYKYRLPAGIPGAINRTLQATVEAHVMDAALPVTLYGVPVKFVAGQIRPVAAADAAAVVKGFLARPYPTNSNQSGLGSTVPDPTAVADVLRRGYMTVKLNNVTAATKEGAVFVRIAAPTGPTPIGGIEAAADGANCVAIPGCVFVGPADADGNTEISYNL